MSQHDMDVANGPGATFRGDMNNALQALASNSVGALAPATTFPCQWWGDTTTSKLKRRNSANTAWIDMGPLDSLGYLLASGGTLTGPINDASPQTIASATTTDIGVATSNVVYISGTTTITGLGTIAAGARRSVRFLAALTLTYNVTSLILPGAVNITTAANDTAEFLSLGSGNWICLRYNTARAAVEYGTNSGGEFWKFESGLLICAKTAALGAATSTAGPIFTCAQSVIGSMPATFVALPYVAPLGITNTSGGGWAACYTFWTTSNWGNWAVYTEVSRAGATTLNLIAIGRWK